MSAGSEMRFLVSEEKKTEPGADLTHISCSGCDDLAIVSGRPQFALCGFDVSDREAWWSPGDADGLICAVCDDIQRCPTCGAWLI